MKTNSNDYNDGFNVKKAVQVITFKNNCVFTRRKEEEKCFSSEIISPVESITSVEY